MAFESNLWKWLRQETKHLSKVLHMCRIETSTMLGYPDIELCYRGKCATIELKGAKRPKRTTTKVQVKVRPEQVIWLKKRWAIGGKAWILLRVGEHKNICKYLISGDKADKVGKVTEDILLELSVIKPDASAKDILEAAVNRD